MHSHHELVIKLSPELSKQVDRALTIIEDRLVDVTKLREVTPGLERATEGLEGAVDQNKPQG